MSAKLSEGSSDMGLILRVRFHHTVICFCVFIALTALLDSTAYRRHPRRRATASAAEGTEGRTVPLTSNPSLPASATTDELLPEWTRGYYDNPRSAFDTAASPWNTPAAELSPTLPQSHSFLPSSHLRPLPTPIERANPWGDPLPPPLISPSAGDIADAPPTDYTFPPISSSSTSPSGSPLAYSPPTTTVPSWWPFRNVRVRRDDIDGIELGDFIRNLDMASNVRSPELPSYRDHPIDIDVDHMGLGL
jgi:hypothetical protein